MSNKSKVENWLKKLNKLNTRQYPNRCSAYENMLNIISHLAK